MYEGMQQHDKAAARKLVRAALKRGWTVSVHDGEEWACKKGTQESVILDAMLNTDSDTLRFRDAEGNVLGTAWLVYGNGPGETIADYSAEGPVAELCEEVQP